jgi:hypothetical protein
MPTSVPLYQPSRANCMRKTCGKTVETVGMHRGRTTHIPTPAIPKAVGSSVQPGFSPHFTHHVYTHFPHAISPVLPLLQAWFSPLSTGPITTTTTYN